ncbi:MAG TPA: hypothetical protein PKY12_11505, partial [Catalimonadaceae bacterium]|nr:hypothetical protein [Catalimonadaceae bacterium]
VGGKKDDEGIRKSTVEKSGVFLNRLTNIRKNHQSQNDGKLTDPSEVQVVLKLFVSGTVIEEE